MFDKQMIRVFFFGLIVIAVTLVLGITFAESETLKHMRFWSVTGPLVASEVLLTVSFCGLIGKSKNKAFPIRIAGTVIPWGYFIFTLLMTLTYPTKLSSNAILAVQAVALLIAFGYIVAVEMAADTVHGHAAESAEANASRMSYRATVDGVLETLRARFPGDKDLGKLFEQLQDAARYACDSVSGAEKIEAELEEKLMKLEQSAESADAEALMSSILQILSAFRKRESIVKALR